MRQVTAQEKYKAVNEGMMAESEFVRQMKLAFPQFVSPANGYSDTVQILKNYNLINEIKVEQDDTSKYSDDSLRRSIDIELEAMGIKSEGEVAKEDIEKAKKKAIKNLKKDPLHYYNLISGESSKVDKHDGYKETKRGKLEKDTFNDMKKATLKERKERLVEGTRALVGFLSGDRLTTTYNHYDGYPSNLGRGLEAHYNNDDLAKDIAMKGYITGMDADTGEISQTHQDPPKKIVLDDDAEERAREIAEEIDGMGADYGYIWDDESNQWVTIKNTGIRSMIDQMMDKLSMMNVYSGDKMNEADPIPTEPGIPGQRASNHDRKMALRNIIDFLTINGHPDTGYKVSNQDALDFIKTHKDDIFSGEIDAKDINDVWSNYDEYESVNRDSVDEKKVNEAIENYEAADYPVHQAFKKAGIDMTKDVHILETDGGTAGMGHGQTKDLGTQSAKEAADEFEEMRKDLYKDFEEYKKDPDFVANYDPVSYEGEYYGDNAPKGKEFKLTIGIFESDMFDIFQETSGVSEKKGKDHDGDGDVDSDDYMAAKDKAIKKAMGKEVNEAPGDDEDLVHELIGDLFAPGNARLHFEMPVNKIAAHLKKYKGSITSQAVKAAMDTYDKLAADGTLQKDYDNDNGFLLPEHILILKKAFGLIGLYNDVDELAGYTRRGEKEIESEPSRFKGRDKSRLRGLKEGRGDMDIIKGIISDRAAESGFEEREEAAEVIAGIADEYMLSLKVIQAYMDSDGPVNPFDVNEKNETLKEAVKAIITKSLEDEMINEAATNDLAKIADEYGSFDGLKPAIIALQNVVTEIESFYDKTRGKIQKIYDDLGEVRNEEGLKVGAFITPSIENAFKRDLRPITKAQFHGGLKMPQVKKISQADVDRGYVQQEAPKQTVYSPVNEKKK